jgi:hypothetical protein
VGGVYRDQGVEVVSEWLISLLQPHVENAYRKVREDHLLPPETEAASRLEAPTSVDPSLIPPTSSEGAGPALQGYFAGCPLDHRPLTALQASGPQQSSAQAGDGVGTRRAVHRGRRRRRRSSPSDGGSGYSGEQGAFIKRIILNNASHLILRLRRCYIVPTSFVDRSRLDRQRKEATERRGYERWMNAFDVTVLSAPSVWASTPLGAGSIEGELSEETLDEESPTR